MSTNPEQPALKPGAVIPGVTGNDGQPLTIAAIQWLGPVAIIDFTDGTSSPPVRVR